MDTHGYPENTVARLFWIILSPLLILFGTFGNCLSIFVLNQRHRPRTSTSTYLSALALCDLLVLYVGLLRQWVREAFTFDIRQINDTMCKVHFYLVNLLLQLSSWILVAITIERVKSVQKPHVAKVGCTRKLANFVLLAEILFLMLLNGHIFFGVKIRFRNNNNSTDTNSSHGLCEPDETDITYSSFMYYAWPWIDCVVVFFLPFLVLMTGNIIIIANVKKSRRFQREIITQTPRITPNPAQKPLIPMTAMLLTLNSVFFVCVGPEKVFSIGQFYWWPQDAEGYSQAVQSLLWAVVNIMMYTNNAVNFLLYVMCGSEFRMEVKRLLVMPCSIYHKKKSYFDRARISTRFQSVNTSIEQNSV